MSENIISREKTPNPVSGETRLKQEMERLSESLGISIEEIKEEIRKEAEKRGAILESARNENGLIVWDVTGEEGADRLYWSVFSAYPNKIGRGWGKKRTDENGQDWYGPDPVKREE